MQAFPSLAKIGQNPLQLESIFDTSLESAFIR